MPITKSAEIYRVPGKGVMLHHTRVSTVPLFQQHTRVLQTVVFMPLMRICLMGVYFISFFLLFILNFFLGVAGRGRMIMVLKSSSLTLIMMHFNSYTRLHFFDALRVVIVFLSFNGNITRGANSQRLNHAHMCVSKSEGTGFFSASSE